MNTVNDINDIPRHKAVYFEKQGLLPVKLTLNQKKMNNDLDGLFRCIISANSNLLLYEKIKELLQNEPEKFMPVVKESPVFWNNVIKNCQIVMFVELAKLYDYSTDNYGIREVIDKCEKHHELFNSDYIQSFFGEIRPNATVSDVIDSAKEKLQIIELQIKKLKNIRNKDLMHLDKKYTADPSNLYNANPFPISEIRLMIDTAKEICNMFKFCICKTQWEIELVGIKDVEGVLLNEYIGTLHRAEYYEEEYLEQQN